MGQVYGIWQYRLLASHGIRGHDLSAYTVCTRKLQARNVKHQWHHLGKCATLSIIVGLISYDCSAGCSTAETNP